MQTETLKKKTKKKTMHHWKVCTGCGAKRVTLDAYIIYSCYMKQSMDVRLLSQISLMCGCGRDNPFTYPILNTKFLTKI